MTRAQTLILRAAFIFCAALAVSALIVGSVPK